MRKCQDRQGYVRKDKILPATPPFITRSLSKETLPIGWEMELFFFVSIILLGRRMAAGAGGQHGLLSNKVFKLIDIAFFLKRDCGDDRNHRSLMAGIF